MAQNVVEYALKVKGEKAKEELKRTGKEADKTAKKVDVLGKKTDIAMKKATKSTKNTRKEFMAIRKDTANLDRLTGELASAFALLSPELSRAATQTSQAAGGMEGVARIFTVANPKILAVVATIGLATAAWQLYRKSETKAQEEHAKFIKKMDSDLTEIQRLKKGIDDLARAMSKLETIQQGLQTGTAFMQMRIANIEAPGEFQQSDFQEAKFIQENNKALETQVTAQENVVSALRETVKLHRQEVSAFKAKQRVARAQPAQKTRVRKGAFDFEIVETPHDLGAADKQLMAQAQARLKINQELLKTEQNNLRLLRKSKGPLADAIKARKNVQEQMIAALRTQEKRDKREKRAEKRAARRERLERQIKEAIAQQMKPLDDIAKKYSNILLENERIRKASIQTNAKILQEEAAVLRIKSQSLQKDEAIKLIAKAERKERESRKLILNATVNELAKQITQSENLLANAEATLIIAETDLETLRKTTKDKSLLIAAEKKVEKARKQTSLLQTQTTKKITNLEKAQRDAKRLGALDEQKRTEQNKNKQLDAIKKINNENEKAAKKESKRIADLQKQRERDLLSMISKIKSSFDTIFNPGQFLSNLTETIGKAFGNVGGAIGGAVGGIIGSIASFGESLMVTDEKTGEQRMKTDAELKAEFDNFVAAFERGMEILPDLLVKVLPKFTIAIAKAIVMSIPMFAQSFADAVRIDGEIMSLQEINDAISNALSSFAGFLGFRSGGRITSARSGMRVTSGAFGAAQLAAVHPNEIITPQSGSRPQAIDRTLNQMSGGQGVTVVINSAVTEASAIDSLVRKIEQRFQTFGSAKSPLFG